MYYCITLYYDNYRFRGHYYSEEKQCYKQKTE